MAGALRLDELGLTISLICITAAAFVIPLAWREEAFDPDTGPGGQAEFQALVISSVLGMVLLAQAQNLVSSSSRIELLSVPLYVLCGAARRRADVARVRPQVPDRRLAGIGDAPLRPGVHLRRVRLDRLRRHRDGDRLRPRRRPPGADRDRALGDGPGVQALGRAVPPVDAGRLPGRAHPGHGVHGGRDQGGGVRGAGALLRGRARPVRRRLAARTGRPRGDLDRRRQRRRARPGFAEAPAGLLGSRPGRLHARRRRRLLGGGRERARLLPRRLHADEPRSVRRHHAARAPDPARRRRSPRSRASPANGRRWPRR